MRRIGPAVGAHQAAPFLARLVACGLLGRAEALAALLHATAPVTLSPDGRAARLRAEQPGPAVCDRLARSQAAHAARSALIALMPVRMPHRRRIAAGLRAAAPTLSLAEVEAIAADLIGRNLRTRRKYATGGNAGEHQSAPTRRFSAPIQTVQEASC